MKIDINNAETQNEKMQIHNLIVGDTYRGELMVVSAERRTAKNGSYLQMVLTDGEIQVSAKKWQTEENPPKAGTVLNLLVSVDEYKGVKSLRIKRMSQGTLSTDLFMPHGSLDRVTIEKQIYDMLSLVQYPKLYKMLMYVFSEDKEAFFTSTAANKMHHSYVGGLAQHTLEVMSLAVRMTEVLAETTTAPYNLDLVIAGAFLHDYGKIETYLGFEDGFELTQQGKFLEHIVIGCQKVTKLCLDFGVGSQWTDLLSHIIVSHHGKLEWGSPVIPAFPEAYIVSQADLISSQMSHFNEIIKSSDTAWTSTKDFALGTRVYTHSAKPVDDILNQEDGEDGGSRQC